MFDNTDEKHLQTITMFTLDAVCVQKVNLLSSFITVISIFIAA